MSGRTDVMRVNFSQNTRENPRFQPLAGNALRAALPQIQEAEPHNKHSQTLPGNERNLLGQAFT
ncbi:hypothetical protein [Nostoc sp.]|uniref:hypothetical protein n=1 Tax=Nostoc sp. TaxID=1180 RepID=UPI002FF6B12F